MKNQNPNTTTTTTNGNINGNDITQTAASQQLQQAMMDPIVSQLYCKILESSWDPELYQFWIIHQNNVLKIFLIILIINMVVILN